MRSPNHLAIKAHCQEVIPSLMKKFGLGDVKSLRRDENGWVNPCFFVNEEYVVRFNARDPDIPKFQREKIVYDLLSQTSLPVPRWVQLDDSRKLIEYDVLISKMLTGRNIEADWPAMAPNRKERLAKEAGSCLRELHKTSFDFFGEITGRGPLPRTSTWIEYLRAKLEFHFAQSKPFQIFNSAEEDLFRETLEESADVLASVQQAHLVHMDYHFGNLLYDDANISAILDFEWSFAGDPLFDFYRWTGKEEWPGSREFFLQGAGKENFSGEEFERMKIYQMIGNLELCPVAAKHFPADEATSYRQVTLDHLAKISRQR